MPDEKKYICFVCGHVGPYDDFEHSEHDPVNDGWVESERCPECGAENTARANPFQTEAAQ